MQMTVLQQVITVAVVILATVLTRFLPFLLFRGEKSTPKFVSYLGQVLPAAVFGLLVIYCFKGVDLLGANHGLPEILAVVAVGLLHLWKRQTLLSIAGGTAIYMLLVQFVFQ